MQAARGVSHRAQGSGPLYYSWGQGQCSLITAIISRDLFPSKPGQVQCCNTPSVHRLLYSHSSLFRNLPWPRNSSLLQAEPNVPSKHLVAAPSSPLGSSQIDSNVVCWAFSVPCVSVRSPHVPIHRCAQ